MSKPFEYNQFVDRVAGLFARHVWRHDEETWAQSRVVSPGVRAQWLTKTRFPSRNFRRSPSNTLSNSGGLSKRRQAES